MDDLTFTSMNISVAQKKFPSELKMGFFRSLDRDFIKVFLICFFPISILFLIGSMQDVPDMPTAQEMEDIQARYAKLVLNKEMPKKEEEKKVEKAPRKVEEVKEEKKEKVDRKKESVVKKQERKKASSVQRAKKRESMKKALDNVGLFAALTATGGGSSVGSAVDLIGDMDASASLDNINLSSSSFVRKKAEKIADRKRRGEITEGGTIEKRGTSVAKGGTFKSSGSVKMNKLDKVEGDASGDKSRSGKAMQRVLRRHQTRIVKVYERYLKRNPDLAGKIVIKFTIEANGSVSNISIVMSELNNPALERDIIKRVKRIKFKSASGKITIEWPLVFSAS